MSVQSLTADVLVPIPPTASAVVPASGGRWYSRYLLFISGMGGLLYGVDVGIIAAALLYLNKTINLSVGQTSIIVAAVLGGSMLSSLVAGLLADWLGRKTMMIISGLMFVVSVGMIVISQGFLPLFAGRLLQGMSGGVIAVVVPLYLAECLPAKTRGQGTAIFQFMLTVGIVVASIVGLAYTHGAEAAIKAAGGDAARVLAAQNAAWRGMFLSVVYPGLIFVVGAFFLSESPRWLHGKGKPDRALAALRRSCSEAEAQAEMAEIAGAAHPAKQRTAAGGRTSLWQRKYVLPFALACVILGLNQTTGINSILAFVVIILKQAGLSPSLATRGDVAVVVLNTVMTLVAVVLVDRKGRKFLLQIGTAGIVVALVAAAVVFHGVEGNRQDVRGRLQAAISEGALTLPVAALAQGTPGASAVTVLSVYYGRGHGDRVESVLSTDADPVLRIAADPSDQAPLTIKRATFGPVPTAMTGWIMLACLCLFIASFAVGPGVVVWLALSELMPTRIRSMGMGIALLINQGVSFVIAAVFLPVVGYYGYAAMFVFWAVCTVVYFLTAAFFLPETKGKTLEEIERSFAATPVRTATVPGVAL